MAFYELHPEKVCQSRYICIPSYETVENVTKYRVIVTIGKYQWTVSRRYSDFFDLNEKLLSSKSIDRFLLPPKKLFGNQTESFIKQRKADLEKYLKALFILDPFPQCVVPFLEFDKYEIRFIIETLAASVWENGDSLLSSGEVFHMAPLQCHALTEILKLPKTSGLKNPKTDIGHILDFLSKHNKLLICGSQKPVGSSNIIPNQLPFSMLSFKSLVSLKLVGCNPEMLKELTNVRKTLTKLQIQDSLKTLKDFLLTDTLHWDSENIFDDFYWRAVKEADFSYNQLTSIDNSIFVLSHVEILDLSHNLISTIDHLERSSYLTTLDLSFNRFSNLSDDLHTKLGNIVSLRLTDNTIESLKGFRKLYSLVELNLKNNRVHAVTEIINLINLPCLEKLNLIGNPITNTVDYRTRVLEQFNSKVSEIYLDNSLPTEKELDTINILQALRRAREAAAVLKAQSDSDALASRRVTGLDEFRQQVLAIRNEGGTGWLRLWNQRQATLPHHASTQLKSPISEASAEPTDENTVESFSVPSFDSNEFTDNIHELILPDWLPDSSHTEFVVSLNTQLIEVMNRTPSTDELHSPQSIDVKNYFWVVILWCPSCVRCFKFPACFVILQSCVVIFLLSDLESDNRLVLLPFRCINAKCLSSINLGFHSHFLRFEEQSAGDVNEYTLLFSNARDCKACAVSLAQIATLKVEMGIPKLENSESSKYYRSPQFYSWVAVDSELRHKDEGTVTCLALNGAQIGLVEERICNLVSTGEAIEVVRTWDAKNDLLNLRIHSNQETDRDKMTVAVHGSSAISPAFSVSDKVKKLLTKMGFAVTIWFSERRVLSVRFASRETRDCFLDALTFAR
uniref:PX domain-containing protein n=1 Tax=Strigamia maritima TaxID=126957 RepID=T1JDN5_STRMM